MKTPLVTQAVQRVVAEAERNGWDTQWLGRLLTMVKRVGNRWYRAQVLFTGVGRWHYALTFYREGRDWPPPMFESDTKVVRRRRDFFAHLSAPEESN